MRSRTAGTAMVISAASWNVSGTQSSFSSIHDPISRMREGWVVNALLFGGVDEDDAIAAERPQLVERIDGRAERCVRLREFSDREAGLFLGLRVDRVAQRLREERDIWGH